MGVCRKCRQDHCMFLGVLRYCVPESSSSFCSAERAITCRVGVIGHASSTCADSGIACLPPLHSACRLARMSSCSMKPHLRGVQRCRPLCCFVIFKSEDVGIWGSDHHETAAQLWRGTTWQPSNSVFRPDGQTTEGSKAERQVSRLIRN